MTGAIFCGGKSSRMGQPKEVMVLKSGITLIEHVYQTLSVFCSTIVLLGKPSEIPVPLNQLKRIADNFTGIGPIAGLEALLSSEIDSEYLILPCDLDQINTSVLKILVDAEGALPIVFRREDRLEPLIGRYSPECLPLIRENIKNKRYSLKGLLADLEHTEIPVSKEYDFALNNVNTIHDFQ
ncbi:MAG: molybdenum cofactor guanylyltransferase [Candidatus Omnitrophica bacterium]|nr:molybdenum cofactor guanylyltransferase [Candidatus Omnitrophota bacterium]